MLKDGTHSLNEESFDFVNSSPNQKDIMTIESMIFN